jgi:hypothetical protein
MGHLYHGYVSHNQMVYVMYFLFESPISSCQRTQPPKKKSRTRPWPALRLCQLCQRRTSPLKTRFFFTRTGNLTRNQYGYTHTYLYIYNTYMYAHVHIYIYLFVCVLFYHILYVCSWSQSEYLELGFPERGINMDEQTNLLCPTSHTPKTPLLRLT